MPAERQGETSGTHTGLSRSGTDGTAGMSWSGAGGTAGKDIRENTQGDKQ